MDLRAKMLARYGGGGGGRDGPVGLLEILVEAIALGDEVLLCSWRIVRCAEACEEKGTNPIA